MASRDTGLIAGKSRNIPVFEFLSYCAHCESLGSNKENRYGKTGLL